jgi:long-chain fatty acid transport protein
MKKHTHVTLAACALLGASQALAGGLWINEFGDPMMGRAGAGSMSGVDDASAALHNPASMTALEHDHVMVTAGFVASEIEFDIESSEVVNGNDNGGDAGGTIPSASAFYVRELSDQWKFGVFTGAFTGSALDHNEQWVARFQVQYVELLAFGAMPSLAYQVTDNFSVGVGVPIMYGALEMDVALPGSVTNNAQATIDGDDIQAAINLSAYWEATDTTRLGLMYQSAVDFEFDGDADIKNFAGSPKLSVDTEMTLAGFLKGSISHDFSDNFSGHVTVGWEGWSDMDTVILSGENNTAALEKDWDDIWHYAVGIEYAFNPTWTLNAGIRYDDSVTEAHKRTADMPIDEQIRYALGLEYQRREDFTISAQMVYADYGDAEIIAENSISIPNPPPIGNTIDIPTGFTGDYKSNDILFFSVSFNWRLGN